MIDIKPLLDKNELLSKYWLQLGNGFREVLEYSKGDDDLCNIVRKLLNDQLLLWIVEDDAGRVKGFITTAVQVIHTDPPQKHLIVDHAWCSKSIQPLTFTRDVHEFVEKYAKELGCSVIKTFTTRSMGRWMDNYGFEQSYVEYRKGVA